jgi:hypothetical protein
MINIKKHLSDDDLMVWKTSMVEQWRKPFSRKRINKTAFESAWAYQPLTFRPNKTTFYYIYFISPKNEDGITKIGISKNPFSRLRSLQTSHYKDLVLNLFFGAWHRRDAICIEKEIHSKLDMYRLRGEWFNINHSMCWEFFDKKEMQYFNGCEYV